MKVLNVMLGRDLGGIQQSFLDYNHALNLIGCYVVNVVSLNSKISPQVTGRKHRLLNLGPLDPISPLQIKCIIASEKPDIIVAHGNRAIKFCTSAHIPLIGVAHNYNIKWLSKCDYVFATTNHLQNYLLEQGFDPKKVMILPNMISLKNVGGNSSSLPDSKPMVIGAMGRFVKKKGFDTFLIALSLLKSRGVQFKAVIGGEGEEEEHLKQLSAKLKLDDCVTFLGWVANKEEFFDQIDIFCLPSTHEPFGIILLEAMARHKPSISTRSEGPSEIIEDGKTGLLCNITPADLSDKLMQLLQNPQLIQELSYNAFLDIKKRYSIEVISKILQNHLQIVMAQ